MGFASELIKSQLFITPPYPTCSFQGQTVIVTGSNQGLGFEALKHIVRLNCTKAIMAVRSLEKGKTAKQTIEQSLNIQSDVIEVWELDLSSFSSVMSFAARVDKCLPRVDALIENAGIATKAFRRLEGNESTITVNVLSTVLLALLLLPKMQRTSVEYCVSPRITVVSSETHFLAKFKEKNAHKIFEALDIEKSADMGDRYFTSKLIQVHAVRQLASLLDASWESKKTERPNDVPRVIINCVNPGFCKTGLEPSLAMRIAKIVFAREAEVGSRTLVAAAQGDLRTHGQYMSNCEIVSVSKAVTSNEGTQLGRRIWDELVDILEVLHPGVSTCCISK